MNAPEKPQAPGTPRAGQARRLLVAGALIYAVLFIILNTHRVDISFVFFTVRTWTLVALALMGIVSFGAGFFVRGRRMKKS
jgi:uncharacterized integral membrane protein